MAVPPFQLGDVIFTCDVEGGTHKLIAAAQVLGSGMGGGFASAVHAAIVIDMPVGGTPVVAEAVGTGLQAQALEPGHYRVYRLNDAALAAYAAACAEGCVAIRQSGRAGAKYGNYNYLAATGSVFRWKPGGQNAYRSAPAKSLFGHESTTFYCSNFVYKAFAAAADIVGLPAVPINHGRSQIGPRDLMAAMASDAANWSFEGRYHQA